jgi:phosphoadenosine phosphosulfate reductase
MQCCNLRKVRPLARGLENADAWFAGLRRDQSSSRSHIKKVELDYTHGGIVKLNPLADWTKEDVWAYVREHDVPYHPLYEQGYPSIGCGPCTRATYPGEDDRAGRWWWEIRGVKECGIHFSPVTGRTERSNGAFVAAMS